MNTPADIWIDVTTLVNWRRPAVGILRVEQQLCRWLTETRPDALRFCRYERATGQFFELDREIVAAHLRRIDAYASQDVAQRPASVAGRLKPLLRGLLIRLGRVSPGLAQALVNARPRLLGWLGASRRLAARLRPRPRGVPAPHAGTPVQLAAGSVYVSLGLDWDYKDMAQLYRLRQANGFRTLFFCYDIIPVRFPQLCVADVSRQFAHYFADLAWAADLVLCISESTRRDLRSFLERVGVPCPATDVIHLGGEIQSGAETQGAVSAAIARLAGEPYILFVSTIERRKNHEILYRAYTRLVEEGIALPRLVFVGMSGWGVQDLLSDIALDPRVQGLIVQLNHVSDAELAVLYRHARFTVYPSLYEGWGLPVAESLAFGKFCLCANTSSLPEVGGDWVEYLDPWDLPAWVERLRHYLTHPEEVDAHNARIAAGYRAHPWSETAAAIFSHAQRLRASASPALPEENPS
jgi:glycosyltransferase involved in cell wall biosynthesis